MQYDVPEGSFTPCALIYFATICLYFCYFFAEMQVFWYSPNLSLMIIIKHLLLYNSGRPTVANGDDYIILGVVKM